MAFRIFFIIILFLLFPQVSLAQSNYVLPYPSGMPGSLSYKFHLLYENASRYWYFGDFGLFDYKQYLLGYKALKKSDFYFPNILFSLAKAKNNNKDISQKKIILKQAMLKHIETLERMEVDTPDTFNWQPEKALPTTLDIKTTIERAINIRKNVP